MSEFKNLLENLQKNGSLVNFALPELGIVNATIIAIKDDVVSLRPTAEQHSHNVIYLHYTSVIVIT